MLMHGNEVLRSFPVALGRNPVGPKREEGDGRTPEGFYILLEKNERSKYYKSIHVTYPNDNDLAQAEARGVAAGGQIMVHGLPQGWEPSEGLSVDWTEGCIAVTNQAMDEIWGAVALGTPIVIKP
jgi:murein L,D-transpeptidase YafK